MIKIIIGAVFVISSAAGMVNEIDGVRYGPHYDRVDYRKIDEIKRLCSQKYNLTFYNVYTYGSGIEANNSVKCAMACELKGRNFVNDAGELDTATYTDEYYKMKYVTRNEDAKKVADYVLDQCFKKWNQDDSNDCDKAFNFQTCFVEEEQDYYHKNRVKSCMLILQGKNDTELLHHPRPLYAAFWDGSCISMPPHCYMDLHRYVIRKGVRSFIAAAEETGFLEDYPSDRNSFEDKVERCYEGLVPSRRHFGYGGPRNMNYEDPEDCNKDLKFYSCFVAEFHKILNLVI